MKHRHHTQKKHGGKRADGGGIRNAVESEARDTKGGFKRGGKSKEGGMAAGMKGHHRLDRKGRMRKASGGSALSSAAKTSDRRDDEPGSGKESVKAGKGEPSEEEPDRGSFKDGGSTKWIQGAHMKKGALHRELGVPEGKKIPAEKLEKAAHSDNPKLRRRAALAETLKSLH